MSLCLCMDSVNLINQFRSKSVNINRVTLLFGQTEKNIKTYGGLAICRVSVKTDKDSIRNLPAQEQMLQVTGSERGCGHTA